MLDHALIGAIRQTLRRNGWRNVDSRTGAPIFTIDRRGSRHAADNASQADVVWALEYLDGLANGR